MTLREEIEAAIEDYSRIFPVPYALAPNLELASRALGMLTRVEEWDRIWGYRVHDTKWGGPAAWDLGELIEEVGLERE